MKKAVLFLVGMLILAVGAQAQSQTEKSTSIVTIGGEGYYVHTVRPGDTFYSLCKVYSTDEATIRRFNPHVDDGLKTGQVLKIPVVKEEVKPLSDRKKRRLFDVHTVNQGETAYSIAKRYGVGLDVLLEDNEGFDPAHLSIGQQINIRKTSQGTSDSLRIGEQIETYTDALNQVSDRFVHHIVARGETLYSLGKQYGIPVDSIVRYNDSALKEGLKQGSILRLPAKRSGTGTQTVAADTTTAPHTLPVVSTENETVKAIDITAPMRVAVLLPMRVNGSSGRQFLEFYQGVLLALEELKSDGISTQVDLFNTARSVTEVESLLQRPELQQADLIIGPVYDECVPPVAAFAAERGIPVVSPLAELRSADNSLLFQVAPTASSKYDKLKDDLSDARHVIVISSARNDAEFVSEITPFIPKSAKRIDYVRNMSTMTLADQLSFEKDNVIVVLSEDETTSESILAYIGSICSGMAAKEGKEPVVRVISSSRWSRFRNTDKDLFFKMNLRYVTSYHADRNNERVLNFDNRYISAFGSLPSLYSYRGYDVAKLFVGKLKLHGAEFISYLNDADLPLLQTPYRFEQQQPGHRYENREWALVCYNGNYTIEVK